jgi:hypothetical protein
MIRTHSFSGKPDTLQFVEQRSAIGCQPSGTRLETGDLRRGSGVSGLCLLTADSWLLTATS